METKQKSDSSLFFVRSSSKTDCHGAKSEEMERNFYHNLKKQSQFQNRQNGVKSILTMVYGDFSGSKK
jgi:hypothetical protein